MARTLKSDKMLFLATLLLVGASVVMVYSASAVQAQAKYQIADYFLVPAARLGGARHRRCCSSSMRVDYHQYQRPAVIWTLLAVTVVAAARASSSLPRSTARRRWMSFGIASVQPSELAKLAVDPLYRRAARAAHASRQRRSATRWCRSASSPLSLVVADRPRARLRHRRRARRSSSSRSCSRRA